MAPRAPGSIVYTVLAVNPCDAVARGESQIFSEEHDYKVRSMLNVFSPGTIFILPFH